MILLGPVGAVCKGDVLDCNVKSFNRVLKDLDSRLYTKWNPKKLKNHGCWEIRIKPEFKKAVPVATIDNVTYMDVKYVENNLVNHVLDVAFLNYDAINRLKQMDKGSQKNWVGEFEYTTEQRRKEAEAKALEELQYNIKQNKSMARDLMNLVQSGIDPARVLTSQKWEMK